jgi:hypothetical protein
MCWFGAWVGAAIGVAVGMFIASMFGKKDEDDTRED